MNGDFMLKKITSIFLSVIITAAAFSMPFDAFAKTYKEQLIDKGFTESYASSLDALHSKYPEWEFIPFKTGLDWQTAVDGERNPHRDQVIQKTASKDDAYFCQCSSCKDRVQEGSTWYSASENAVKYYMDPRNWLNEEYIFQFESTAYSTDQTKSGVESIISSTWMNNADITYNSTQSKQATYLNSSGKPVKYSDAIIAAAKSSSMSAYYLASKIVQEVGARQATAGGVCGTRAPFIGMYNYYNIGAYTGASDGLHWAAGFLKTKNETFLYPEYNDETKTAEGTAVAVAKDKYASYIAEIGNYYKVKLYDKKGSNSYSTDGETGYILKSDLDASYFTYGRPWTNPYLTIYYGAQYIAKGYSKYQYTGYLQKFNVNKDSGNLYSHEYMTNVNGAASEALISYRAYINANLMSQKKTFYIPVYNNMPEKKCGIYDENADTEQKEDTSNKVTGLTLTSRGKTSLKFKWNSFESATKYYIQIQNNTSGNSFNKTVTTNSASLNGLTPANEYSVKVRAYAANGWSNYSAVNTKHTTPDKLQGIKLKSKGDTSVTLSWTSIKGASGYNIYSYDSKKKSYTKLLSVEDGGATSGKVTSLKSSTSYSFAVCAYVSDSTIKEGAKSDIVSAKTGLKKVAISSLTSPSTTKIKASWSKATGSENGYEIYYARDKAFKKIVAKKDIASIKTTSYTGKNFTKGVTYYVKVRSYKKTDKKKNYGAWSAVKSVKCK